MPQIFRPAADTIIRCVLAAAILVPLALVGLAYAFARSPYVTNQEIVVQQPVPFSHQHHVGDSGWIAATATRALSNRPSLGCLRQKPA